MIFKIFYLISFLLFTSVHLSCTNGPDTEFSAEWAFSNHNFSLYDESWNSSEHKIFSMDPSGSQYTVVRAEEGAPFGYSLLDFKPAVQGMLENDYMLWEVPVERLSTGSYVEFTAAFCGDEDAPKYFIMEYFDGGEWKSSENDLLSVPENPELKYSFILSGKLHKNYQRTSVYQTFRLEDSIEDDNLKIRCRVVTPYSCSGAMLDASSQKNKVVVMGLSFSKVSIKYFGNTPPKDTLDILCLGNSFTYYWNSPAMLKEIAWSQGHYFDITAHTKGGQTLSQHTKLELTRAAIEADEFDYVFLQDQSRNPGRYAKDPSAYDSVREGYLELCEMVRSNSPKCKLILEHTWAYSKDNYGGFGSYDAFCDHLYKGCEMLSGMNGADISPIGSAFREVSGNEEYEIDLITSDKYHQSHYGSYLKACVNYLFITKKPFDGEVAGCGINPKIAQTLRDVAEKVVFSK